MWLDVTGRGFMCPCSCVPRLLRSVPHSLPKVLAEGNTASLNEKVYNSSSYSMSASQVHFSTYNITICNKAFISSWHETLFCCQVLSNVSDTAELKPSGKASTHYVWNSSPYFSDLFKYLFLPLYTVALIWCSLPVRCLLLNPPPPTALCGEKFALFNNYCTLAWLLQLSVQRWLSKCHMPMTEMKNLLLPLSCVPRKMQIT